jgi:HK97 family phage portal protein
MNLLFGYELRRKDSPVPQTGFWHRITEPFAGAWQHNVECDGTERVQAFSAVYACMTRIANDIAKMPLLPVLRKPNPYQNRIQFMVCWILSKLQTGNAYILKERDGRGMVVALYVLNPTKVKPMVADDGRVFYKLSRDDLSKVGDEINVPASEIIHDLMNPLFHPLAGVSPLYACGMAATQGNRIQANSATHFQNNSMPSGILTSPGEITEKQGTDWSLEWKERFGGRNRGNVAILGGGLKYEAITMSAGESQLIEQLKWTAEDVARAFGVPLYKINAGPVPISNNAEVINLQYFSDTLQTLIESVEVCMDEGLGLGEAPNASLGTEFDLTVLLRMDSASQIDMLSKGVSGAIYSPNEARAIRNLPPVKGGETPYLQQQNFSLSALSVRDAGEPFAKPAPATAPEPAEDEPGDVGEDQMRALLGRVSKAALGVQAR